MSCKYIDERNAKEKKVEEESFAMYMLKECSKLAKRWFLACMIILVMWLLTIGAFVWYLNQYDFVNINNGTGTSNYIGGSGEIKNGNN